MYDKRNIADIFEVLRLFCRNFWKNKRACPTGYDNLIQVLMI